MLIRYSKILLVLSVALDLTLVVFGNLTDYHTNFDFFKGVMSMSTTFPHNQEMWRAIHESWADHTFYVLIIVWEAAVAVTCWVGGVRMFLSVRGTSSFAASKDIAGAGLTLGLLLWMVAFTTVGGEWFLMWQSTVWNGLEPAFRMFSITGMVLLILYLPDWPEDAG